MANFQHTISPSLENFSNHFAATAQYGERWQTLYPALKADTRLATLYNRYAPLQDFNDAMGINSTDSLERVRFPSAPDDIQADNLLCFIANNDLSPPPPERASNDLLTHCNLDAASVVPVHILQVLPGDNVLDLVADSGVNSLSLAQSIWPYLQPDSPTPPMPGAKKGTLHSNEYIPGRASRIAALEHYLPASLTASGQQKVVQIDITNGATELPLGPGGYDKALVDAPFTDERRIVQAQQSVSEGQVAEAAARWDSSSPERAAEAPLQLLSMALEAVRLGGRVVYTTSSISREENDGVVERVLQELKHSNSPWTAEVERLDADVERDLEARWAEKTAQGWMVLPDHESGARWGPRYFCVLKKSSI